MSTSANSPDDSVLSGRQPSGRAVFKVAIMAAPRPVHRDDGPPSILGEGHIQLRVTDLDRSARFCTEIVGLHEHLRSPVQVIVTCGAWEMGLIASTRRSINPKALESRPRYPYDGTRAGLQHLAFALGSAADVDAAATWLDQHGVPRRPVCDGYTPGSRYVTFYDPDGIPLEYYYLDAAFADIYGLDIRVHA